MDLTPEERLRQSTWDVSWVPAIAEVVQRDEVTYTRSGRDVPPLNSVYRVEAEGPGLAAVVEEVSAAHDGVASRWALAAPWPEDLPALLEAAGYVRQGWGTGYVLPVARYVPQPRPGVRVVQVETLAMLEAALAVAYAGFGIGWKQAEDQLRHTLTLAVGEAATWPHFLALDADDRPIASATLRVLPHLGFGYLMGGATLPDARGRGAYSALLDTRIAFARRAGLEHVGLYAHADTSAPIVARRGFEACESRMTAWHRPAAG